MFTLIKTERLVLRKFKESDALDFLEYRTNPQVTLFQGNKWLSCKIDQVIGFLKEQANFKVGVCNNWFQIAIALRESGILIGDCAIHTLDDINQVEIGFTINPLYQNKGYAIEAVRYLLGYLFNDLNINRVIAIVDVKNLKSIKLLEKIGMRKEGHTLKSYFNNGTYIDEYLYAILKEEYL